MKVRMCQMNICGISVHLRCYEHGSEMEGRLALVALSHRRGNNIYKQLAKTSGLL